MAVIDLDTLEIYVDGSYNAATKTVGSGIVILDDDVKTVSITYGNNDEGFKKMRNVAGEINAATIAMYYAKKNRIKKICICYDYEGIEKWCTGEWNANNPYTVKYREFYKKCRESVQIQFLHVKAHAGDAYNEMADMLAKNAAGILEYKPNFDIMTQRMLLSDAAAEEWEVKKPIDRIAQICNSDKYQEELVLLRSIKSELKDSEGHELQLGDSVYYENEKRDRVIGYVDYDEKHKRYFYNFENYWSMHPFKQVKICKA